MRPCLHTLLVFSRDFPLSSAPSHLTVSGGGATGEAVFDGYLGAGASLEELDAWKKRKHDEQSERVWRAVLAKRGL